MLRGAEFYRCSWRRRGVYAQQIPDIDAVMHIHDRPVVPANPAGGGKQEPPPPVFGYTTTENFTDIPFPDFSYWGHEHGRIGGAPPTIASLHIYCSGTGLYLAALVTSRRC